MNSRCTTPTGKVAGSSHPERTVQEDRVHAEARRLYRAKMEAKHRWSERFPLTLAVIERDIGTVPHGREVHAARVAERWGVHPEIARTLVYMVFTGHIPIYDSWDTDDTKGGMYPDDVSRWWA